MIAEVLVALVSIGATLFSVWAGKKYMEKRRQNCLVSETIQNANVYTALQFTLEELGADRAYILEFHNGEKYFSGRGQQKFSCSYEVVRHGISAESSNSQNHRISNYHTYISELVKEGDYSYLMNDHDKEMFSWVRAFNPYDLYTKSKNDIFNLLNYFEL